MPRAPWNWWVMGGLGAVTITDQGATDQERHDAQRPLAQFGVGVERRFRRFALNAELSAIATGVMKQDATATPAGTAAASTTTSTNTMTVQPTTTSSDKLSGGQLTIGASFYF
jgi:hypothetical protein